MAILKGGRRIGKNDIRDQWYRHTRDKSLVDVEKDPSNFKRTTFDIRHC